MRQFIFELLEMLFWNLNDLSFKKQVSLCDISYD